MSAHVRRVNYVQMVGQVRVARAQWLYIQLRTSASDIMGITVVKHRGDDAARSEEIGDEWQVSKLNKMMTLSARKSLV